MQERFDEVFQCLRSFSWKTCLRALKEEENSVKKGENQIS